MSTDNKLIYQGNLIGLSKQRIDYANGGHTYFDIVKHPGGAVIAAIDEQNKICMLKQWRHAIQKTIWELPAGCLEPNESPLDSAKRELEEETGVVAKQWQSLGEIYPSPGFSNEILHLYVARGIGQGVAKLDDAEQLEAFWLPFSEVKEMAITGKIVDAKTLALLFQLDCSN